jgi:hypothetical protein
MAFHIFNGCKYIKFLVYDDTLHILVPIFIDDTGLSAFTMDLPYEAYGLKDANIPEDVLAHVGYHETIEAQILVGFAVDLRGKTTDGKHGHFPMLGDAGERINIISFLWIKKLISKPTMQALIDLVQ